MLRNIEASGKIPEALQMFRPTQAISPVCGGNEAFGPSTGTAGGLCGNDRGSLLLAHRSLLNCF